MGTCVHNKYACLCRVTPAAAWLLGLAAGLGWFVSGGPAAAVLPDSPEVRKLVESALAAIEKPGSTVEDTYAERLGTRCLVGLAFLKAGKPEHPRVDEAIKAVRANMTSGETIDVYSNGIVIVFLCELSPERYRRETQWYLDLMRERQKEHGGWGYD